MHSIEKYLALLLRNFFREYKSDYHSGLFKEVVDYINKNSRIYFENIFVSLKQSESGFVGFLSCKSLPEKIEFEFNIK